MSRRLLELARLHEQTVTIEGETIRIREPNGLQMMKYRQLRKEGDLTAAIASLIEGCCIDAEGKTLYTAEEAKTLASAKSEIFLPLLLALMSFEPAPEKKRPSSSPTSSSAAD
jgi:hypothetical protein